MGNPPSGLSPLSIPSLFFFPPLSVPSVPLCFKTLKTQRHKVHRVSYKSLYPNPENPFRLGVPFLYLFPYLPLSNSLPLSPPPYPLPLLLSSPLRALCASVFQNP